MSTLSAPTAPGNPGTSPRTWSPAIWSVLFCSFLARGLGFVYPFLGYHATDLQFSTADVLRVVTAFGVGWLAGSIVCGRLADRIGRRTTLVGAMTVSALTLPVLAQVSSLPAVLICAVIAGAVYDAPRPITTALIADLIPTKSAQTAVESARTFAITVSAEGTAFVGGMLAGALGGVAPLIWVQAGASVLCAVIVLIFLDADRPARSKPTAGLGYRAAVRDVRLDLLVAASLCALTGAAGMFTSLPLLMSADGLDETAYGLTHLAAGAAVLVCTPLMTPWLSRRADRGPMLAPLAAGSLVLGAGMTAAGASSTTLGYCAAAALIVPGEIAFFAAVGNILGHIAPADARGTYAGVWGITLAGAVIIAPLLTGWSMDRGGDAYAALTAGAMGLLGAALTLPLAALMRRSPDGPHTPLPQPSA
ncbi:MFS transporter [Streptomyces sp. NPDC059881]|uniref:MFS transporter n=1 Tax=Streptomyces sp. NPDC059881 TaxID=3346986 RepID=UPI0036605B89